MKLHSLPVILSISRCPLSNKKMHKILYTEACVDSSDFSVARDTISCNVLLPSVDSLSNLLMVDLHELTKCSTKEVVSS